mgnify:CR=1 FL=1|jgi:hypothetical protein|tara:strand:- start:702 stop:1160 length:459 start_codon:yes stop_codon:yes gene_type:complete
MASTITSGTLTVKVTETIALNGTNMDATNTLTVNAINEINQRIVTLAPQDIIILYEFGTVVGPGKFIYANTQYLRVTNKDDTNPLHVNVCTASTNQWVSVTAGQSFMCSMDGSQGVASGTVAGASLANITKISVENPSLTDALDIDCYVALT